MRKKGALLVRALCGHYHVRPRVSLEFTTRKSGHMANDSSKKDNVLTQVQKLHLNRRKPNDTLVIVRKYGKKVFMKNRIFW